MYNRAQIYLSNFRHDCWQKKGCKMQSEVERLVWPWRERLNPKPSDQPGKKLRVRAIIQCCVMLSVSGVLWYFGKPVLATVASLIAALVLISGLVVLKLYLAIDKAGQRLGQFVGQALTWALLVPFYFICFTCGAWLARIMGKDPLCRAYVREATTYWEDRKVEITDDYYRKQF